MNQLAKFTFLTLVIIFTKQLSFGQVVIGVKAGGSLTNVKVSKLQFVGKQNPKLGFNAGLLAHININEKLLIRPEVLYSVKGWQYPANQYGSSGVVNLNYLNVPLLAGYKPIEKLTVFLGPEVGLLTSAIGRSKGKNNNITEFYNKWDLGVDVGLAYNLNSKFGVELRYNYGFKGVYSQITFTDENGNPIKSVKDGSNRALQLGVFYLFNKN